MERYFDLYLNAGVSVPLVINANQYDKSETWLFTLYDETGIQFRPASGSIVGLKADGNTIMNAGTVNSSGQVVIQETEQITAVAGKNEYELILDGTHGTANFVVLVERRPGDNAVPSESDISLISQAVQAASGIEAVLVLQNTVASLREEVNQWVAEHAGTTNETTLWEGDLDTDTPITLSHPATQYDVIAVYTNIANSDNSAVTPEAHYYRADEFKQGSVFISCGRTDVETGASTEIIAETIRLITNTTGTTTTVSLDTRKEVRWNGQASSNAGITFPTMPSVVRITGIKTVQDDQEIIQARVGKDGTQYSTLKARLDAEEVIVDSSLTVSGAAADAKKVGDEISDLKSAISCSVTEVIQTTGSAINQPIPYKISKGISYLITIDADNPNALNSLVTRETSGGATIETVFYSAGECNNLLFTAEHDANYFAFMSSYGATVTISTLNATDAYILAKTNEQNSKTDLSLNSLFNPSGYYATNQGVNGTASGTITSSATVIGLKVSCSAGDTFSITGEGASTGRLWCLTDENLKILSVAATSKTETNLELEATANGYLIVNVYKNSTFNIIKHKGQLKTADLQEQIDEISTIDVYDTQSVSAQLYRSIATNGVVGSTVNADNPSASSAYECAVVPVINGETYLLNGYGGSTPRLWCLTDGDYKILSASASSLDASTVPVTIEVANNGYLIINSTMSTGITLKKLKTDETLSIIQQNYTDIEALKSNKTHRDIDFANLLNIPLVEFDLKDYEVLDVSNYRSLVDYDSPSRQPMLEQFYSLFDSLVTDYPNYVSRVDAATECSLSYPEYANGIETEGTYEVTPAYKTYMYKFIDTNIGAGNSAYNTKKRLLITCCTHGNEVMTPFNAFVLASELCKGTNPNYAKLRGSFDIYIIPCLNGYGMYHTQRPNANWVDINRNFPTQRWYVDGANTIGDKNQCVYTGAEAGSEFETQLVMALNELIKPDFHIDHHNYSGGNGQFYTNVTEQSHLRLVHQCLVDCSIAFVKAFPTYFGNEYLLVIPNSEITYAPRQTVDNKNGKMEVWFSENGCSFSCTIEIASDVRYNNGAITQTTQDWAGNTTFSIAEYTLRNQLLRYGQYVLQLT